MFSMFYPSICPQRHGENVTSNRETSVCDCKSLSPTRTLDAKSEFNSSTTSRKPFLKFSIDHILGIVSDPEHSEQKIQETRDNELVADDIDDCVGVNTPRTVVDHLCPGRDHKGFLNSNDDIDTTKFQWLQCTRYHPPKLQRSKKKEGQKMRRLDRNPRVPFTQHQLAVLEGKFVNTHYLSSMDVSELSSTLSLTETRVKIWFQNRRARHRREKEAVLANQTTIVHKPFQPLAIPSVSWPIASFSSSQHLQYHSI